jgi:hypothetical protein
MPQNPTPPYWLRAASAPSLPVSEPDADPEEPFSSAPRSTRHSLGLLLAVFVVAVVCVNLWPDEGHVASSAEATGIPAEAVIASLAAERREHAARAGATRALESAIAGGPTSGETQPQSPGGKAGSKDQDSQPATTQPGGGNQTPAKENLTLPIVGETPLPESEVPGLTVPEVPLPDVSAAGVSTPELPALPDVLSVPDLPSVPGTLLP